MLRLIVLLVIFMIGQCHGGTVTTSLYLREEIVSPDGYPRVGITVNGTMPGPPIEANRGDTLIITVFNQMPLATTVHWHGILQTGSYYMDGTAMITQCPIPPSQSFTYRFIVDRAGTFFYHAHLGGQNADGLLGPLIVTEASDPVSYGYDFEYTVFIQDWFHVDAATIDLMKSKGYVEGLTMDSALINGLGTFNCSNYRAPSASTPFSCTENEVTEPSSFQKFQMQPGKRYRFRIICAATTFNFLVSFDGHPLKLINTDGNKIVPVTVDYLHVYSGERYDVIIEANQVPGNYWLRVALPNGSNDVRGQNPFSLIILFRLCIPRKKTNKKSTRIRSLSKHLAILQYTTIPLALPETVANLTRPLNLTELRSTEDMPNYDQTYNIDVSKVVDPANPGQHWAMNGIIFQHPTGSFVPSSSLFFLLLSTEKLNISPSHDPPNALI